MLRSRSRLSPRQPTITTSRAGRGPDNYRRPRPRNHGCHATTLSGAHRLSTWPTTGVISPCARPRGRDRCRFQQLAGRRCTVRIVHRVEHWQGHRTVEHLQVGHTRREQSPRSAETLRRLLSSKVVKAQLAERRDESTVHVAYTKGLHELGDGLYAYLQPDGGWGWSNAGLVTAGGTSLLIDTLYDLRLT